MIPSSAAAVAAYDAAEKMFPGMIFNFRFERYESGAYWYAFHRKDQPAPYYIRVAREGVTPV
mgnify:CR=1 FL=1